MVCKYCVFTFVSSSYKLSYRKSYITVMFTLFFHDVKSTAVTVLNKEVGFSVVNTDKQNDACSETSQCSDSKYELSRNSAQPIKSVDRNKLLYKDLFIQHSVSLMYIGHF